MYGVSAKCLLLLNQHGSQSSIGSNDRESREQPGPTSSSLSVSRPSSPAMATRGGKIPKQEYLGKGAFGSVYKVTKPSGEIVAVKKVKNTNMDVRKEKELLILSSSIPAG